ncbi:MAG TPA: LLM class flavin-dependent oxidoreductase [Steroidobacteraceae bacterium]|nr:LLM class flavin-dependent oxidoreductase [Steroidobacteraceae bacterium]
MNAAVVKVDVILEAGLPPAQVQALAAQADRYAIQTLWVSSFPAKRDPVPALVLAAQVTQRLRLGTLPVSPYEVHPLRIADQLRTLNEHSAGRSSVLIGGLGHSVARVTGLEPRRRVTAVRDALQIVKQATAGGPANYQGELFSICNYVPPNSESNPTRPPPHVYAGATQPQMLRMASAIADGTMLSDAPLSRLPEVLQSIDAGLGASGRTRSVFRINNFMAWHVKSDLATARAEARREIVWRGFLLPWFTSTFLEAKEVALVEAMRPAFLQAFLERSDRIEGVPTAIVDALIDNLTLTGDLATIDRIAQHIHELHAAGLDEIALRLHDAPEEGLRIIGEHLIPALS